ncbi:asparaginase [Nonomuraea sp. B5E05]|uniref:asparaginase n=1 Tax=Nonomuraea sp. B5E05 TaxID=3153569 RepID=UPI0032605AD9
MADNRRRIHVLALGGTIAMTGGSDAGGASPTLDADILVEAVPEAARWARIEAETFLKAPGAQLRLTDLVRLSSRIKELLGQGAEGVVVTQGTDTIEETAMALDLLSDAHQPIVVTGAMRNPAQAGADGPANLRNAVLVAAGDRAPGLGVLVTMNDEIHAARFVRKTHASRPSAFTSALPLGWIAEDRVRIPVQPSARVHVALPPTSEPAPVALVSVALGDDGRMLRLLAEQGYQGAVVAGFGVGHVPEWQVTELAKLGRRMPVVIGSRTGEGEGFRHTYGFDGSERDLLRRGLISAGALDPLKARVLLSLALGAGWPSARIAEALDTLSG